MSAFVSDFLDGVKAFLDSKSDTPNTSVEYADSESHALPPIPYRRDSTPTPRPPPAYIDLSSPPRPSSLSIPRDRGSEASRPRTLKSRRSADEKRLFGDYRTPADAVAAPPPEVWMSSPGVGQVTMHRKPGSNNSYQPINTINDNSAGFGRSKPVTYSKQHRKYPPGIGQTRLPGQTAYLALTQGSPAAASGNGFTSRNEHHEHDSSSAKRRKTEHIINLDDDDDDVVTLGSSLPSTSVPVSNKAPSFTKSTIPSRSTASGSISSRGVQRGYGVSEFEAVNTLADPRRKAGKKSVSTRSQDVQPTSVCEALRVRTKVPTRSISVHDYDSDGDQKITARGTILGSFRQGVTDDPAGLSPLSRRRDTTTSSHFPKARINESTSELPERRRAHAEVPAVSHQDRLDRFMKAKNIAELESSEDELALSTKPGMVRKKATTVSQVEAGSHSGSNRKNLKGSKKGWPLRFARSHDHELHGSDTSDDLYDLVLRTDTSNARVVVFDRSDGVFETKMEIKPGAVITVQGDGISRVRLQGPRGQDGNSPYFDLQFVRTPDYHSFCENHAIALSQFGKVTKRAEEYMTTLFSKPLPKNDKVGKSALADMAAALNNNPDESTSTSRVPLWGRSMRTTTNAKNVPKQNWDSDGSSATTRTSTRPARTTRSSMPKYDLDDVSEKPRVEKFSQDIGLGPPWSKTLEYGEGRQRAVVHFDDLPRLDEEEFMNDSLIDFYMIYLFKKLNVPSDKVYFFNTYFFTQLTKNTGRNSINYAAVERWTSKIDIFTYDYIVVPINESTHWYLAIVCNISRIDRKPVVDLDEDSTLDTQRTDDLDDQDKENAAAAETMDPSINLEDEPDETGPTDLNLFDEESTLSMVDRDTTREVQVDDSQDKAVPRSPTVVPADTAQMLYDPEVVTTGILSRFTMSPKKRKGKRRFTQHKKDPNVPIIVILDSLGSTRTATVRALKDWLAAEGAAKRGMEATIKENGYYPKATQIPMQDNYTDCGVYLLGYVEKFFQNPDDFKTKLLTAEMSSTEDWPELQPKEMRANMRKIICTIAEEQKVARKVEKRARMEADKMEAMTGLGKNQGSGKQEVKVKKIEDDVFGLHATKNNQQFDDGESALSFKQPHAESPRGGLTPSITGEESHTKEAGAHLQNMEDVREICESPSTVVPEARSSSEVRSERKNQRKSPEVRVLVKSSPAHNSVCTRRRTSVAMTGEVEHIRSPERTVQDEQRPKRNDPSNHETNEPRLLTPKARSKLPARSTKKTLEPYAEKSRTSREGSVGQPIMIEDSQDVEFLMTQPPDRYDEEVRVDVLPPQSPNESDKQRTPTTGNSARLRTPPRRFQPEATEADKMDVDGYEYVDVEAPAQQDNDADMERFALNDEDDEDVMEVDSTNQDAVVQETPQSSQTLDYS